MLSIYWESATKSSHLGATRSHRGPSHSGIAFPQLCIQRGGGGGGNSSRKVSGSLSKSNSLEWSVNDFSNEHSNRMAVELLSRSYIGDLSLHVFSLHKHENMWPYVISTFSLVIMCLSLRSMKTHIFWCSVEISPVFAQRKMSPFCQNGPQESIFMWVHLRALEPNLEVETRGEKWWGERSENVGSRVLSFLQCR